MELVLKRSVYTSESTIGELLIDDLFFCYTLEDVCRDLNKDGDLLDNNETKIYGKTAIPNGRYEVVINFSNRFQKKMPLLLNVLGFEGIRIHAGNKSDHTQGCILLGYTKGSNFIGSSKKAFSEFMVKLENMSKKSKIYITILDKG